MPSAILDRLASAQGSRSDVPNQELARDIAQARDREGIRAIAANLWSRDPQVQSDCIKVLYEIGYIDPALIADYAPDFLRLLESKNNRLVWGGMIALSTVAPLRPQEVFGGLAGIVAAMAGGSVITRDAGVSTLAALAAASDERRRVVLPYVLDHLATCRPQSVAQHAERALVAVDAGSGAQFVAILEKRLPELSAAQQARVRRAIGKAGLVP